MNDFEQVRPVSRGIHGTVRVPGDKSISHRLAMLCGLAQGESVLEGFLTSEDCLNTLAAMESLGAKVSREGTRVHVTGTGGRLMPPGHPLDMGNSGTGIRLLAGLLAGYDVSVVMTGDASLCSRPMRRIQEPLVRMGARMELTGEKGCAPIRIQGGNLKGIRYELPMASAQVKSCVLLAGLHAQGQTVVVEPKPTRDHTERLLRAMGVEVRCEGSTVSVDGISTALSAGPGIWTIPGDFSSAAFWLTAAACSPGANVTIEGVGLNPRRTAFLDVLKRMGASVQVTSTGGAIENEWEPRGSVTVKGGKLSGCEVGGEEIPNLIDELPLVAVAGALADGRTTIQDAQELRVKESDRISATVKNLRCFGVEVEERTDGMLITGGRKPKVCGDVESYGDHRMAMAMAVLTLFADRPMKIMQTACIATSYPGFWKHLEALTA